VGGDLAGLHLNQATGGYAGQCPTWKRLMAIGTATLRKRGIPVRLRASARKWWLGFGPTSGRR